MTQISPILPVLRRAAWLAAAVGLGAATLVSAQPAPSPQQPPPAAVPPASAAPAPEEEAPPINVPTPAPLLAPPISAKEVAPAPPSKAQVEEKPATEAPTRRARYDVAVLQALDKVTAESVRFEAAVGRPVRYKSLVFTVKACDESAPDEAVEDSIVYMTVDLRAWPGTGKPTPPPRQAFKGWMYAASPGLNPLEHPVYDAWLITCRAAAPAVASSR